MRASLERRAALVAWAAAATVLVGGAVYCFVLGPELRYYDEKDYLGLARSGIMNAVGEPVPLA